MNPILTNLFNQYRELTGSAEAAATLVLAQVQSTQQPELPQPTTADFLTVKEAAKKYNIGERTIYRMVEDGLPVARVGKAIRIKPRELSKWLEDSETILR
jgi:excisionase family DNA binding protein